MDKGNAILQPKVSDKHVKYDNPIDKNMSPNSKRKYNNMIRQRKKRADKSSSKDYD